MYFSWNFYKAIWNANSSSLVFPHCFLLLTVVDSGLLTHLDWSLLLFVLDCLSASLFANCPLWVPLPTGSLCVPLPIASLASLGPAFSPPFPVSSEISESKPYVWFRAKTDKGIVCLADHPHSVTNASIRWLEDNINKSKERLIKSASSCTDDIRSNRTIINDKHGGARGVMVIVVGNGHGDTSSNHGRDRLHFTQH